MYRVSENAIFQGPCMDIGVTGWLKECTGEPLSYFFDFDSCFIESDNKISIKCVRLLIWTPSIWSSIHLSNSGDNRIATYSFTISNTYLQCNTKEHINTRLTISNFVLQSKTNGMNDLNERERDV